MAKSRAVWVVGALAVLGLAGSGIAVAASNDVITACVSSSGNVRIPSTAQPSPSPTPSLPTELAPAATREPLPGDSGCVVGERVITWNQTGPQGPQGDTGAAGPPGAAFSGREAVMRDTVIAPGTSGYAYAECPAGKLAMTGHYTFLRTDMQVYTTPLPINDVGVSVYDGDSWSLYATNTSPNQVRIRVWAICVNA
ncbi:hypothetical protein [Nonomuraea zeae]|uniref:Collagen-like protein n=1 Tax=Nonomuraea zeae TaxID=1642303 RepID=A0A5S4G6R1_9ACTN|nr:hypothetical protein [Nonomuraea zeae]TMR28705.1 hypothetical protein ETD85_34830 [Nonomuraea zeae]